MRIAVDVLGGDHAPREVLLGVAQALQGDFAAGELLLVGPTGAIEEALQAAGIAALPEIVHTSDFVESHEKPVVALRAKPKASISLCVKAVAEGRAGGMISFGNTGATVAGASFGLGMLPGIRRPGIAVVMTGIHGKLVLLDAGANPAPKPLHLFQYGIMGLAYARDILQIAEPRLGLLNIGGEAGKGSQVAKEAYELFRQSGVSFHGNVEGQELFLGVADVLVTDGFVGNMVLKVVEGFAEFLTHEMGRTSAAGSDELKSALRRIIGAADYAEVGGATLLGVNGVVLIGHGRSDARAVSPALRAVRADIDAQVNRHITESLRELSEAAGLSAEEPAEG